MPTREQIANRRRWMERLAYYVLGVAIGLVILGIYWSNRQRAVQRQQAQQQVGDQAQPTQGGDAGLGRGDGSP